MKDNVIDSLSKLIFDHIHTISILEGIHGRWNKVLTTGWTLHLQTLHLQALMDLEAGLTLPSLTLTLTLTLTHTSVIPNGEFFISDINPHGSVNNQVLGSSHY